MSYPDPSLPVLGKVPEPAINSLGADSTPAKSPVSSTSGGASTTCRTGLNSESDLGAEC